MCVENGKINEIVKMRKDAALRGEPVLREASFALLLKTISERKPKKILEIGTNEGLSSSAMLLISPEAKLSGIEIDEKKIATARSNYKKFGVCDRAKIFCGDACDIIPALSGMYDFIFLDGPKGHYYRYLPDLLRVLSVGGVLFADNVLFRGYVEGTVKTPHRFATTKHSMENFIGEITTRGDLKTVIYKLEDGVSITEKLR